MPQLDLTTLSGPELRQLLDSARARGRAAQSYEILQEMARRREGEAGPGRVFGGRRREAEPRLVDLDLGDPLERAPEPWEVEPLTEDGAEPPLTLAREPAPTREIPAGEPPPPRVVVRRGPGSALGFALGGLAGLVLGLGAGGGLREMLFPNRQLQAAEAVSPMPPVSGPPPVATAVLEASPTPLAPMDAVAPAGPLEEMPAGAMPADMTTAPTPPVAPAAVTPALAPLAPLAPEPPTLSDGQGDPACAAQPTPADRTICADPELKRLQRDLRRAYAEALKAHAEKGLLRQRQLAWRDARNGIEDPAMLAELYEARIRRLEAAAADARARR